MCVCVCVCACARACACACVCVDIGALHLEVGLGHMKDTSMVIGQVQVDNLAALTEDSALSKYVYVTTTQWLLLYAD